MLRTTHFELLLTFDEMHERQWKAENECWKVPHAYRSVFISLINLRRLMIVYRQLQIKGFCPIWCFCETPPFQHSRTNSLFRIMARFGKKRIPSQFQLNTPKPIVPKVFSSDCGIHMSLFQKELLNFATNQQEIYEEVQRHIVKSVCTSLLSSKLRGQGSSLGLAATQCLKIIDEKGLSLH